MSRLLLFTLLFLTLLLSAVVSQPLLDPTEQQSLYSVLTSINPTIPWLTLFPDDFCLSSPHGVVCDYFTQDNTVSAHITELSFGYVSDYTPNPPCSPNATLNPLIFTSFKFLRKLFFYKCFIEHNVTFEAKEVSFSESIEEVVFIDNPGLVGGLDGAIGNFSNIRRLVLSGNGFYGNIPHWVSGFMGVEEITLSRNKLSGNIELSFAMLKELKVLDLSYNFLDGNAPESIGNLSSLLKLDLSYNGFNGKIPDSFGNLKSLEFLDLGFNKFGNFGVPLWLSEMPRLREVHLSGNLLGGQIPEIWRNLRVIMGIGFSNMGLVGKIPASLGIHLKKLCYLGLDNNKLDGEVPKELGLLEFVNEINLENNNLSGRVPFSANVGEKLKLKGNTGLCVDSDLGSSHNETSSDQLKLCHNSDNANSVLKKGDTHSSVFSLSSPSMQVLSSSYLAMLLGFLFVFGSIL